MNQLLEELALLYWEDDVFKARHQLLELGLEHSKVQLAMQQLYNEPRVQLETRSTHRMRYDYDREQERFYNYTGRDYDRTRGNYATRDCDRVQGNFYRRSMRDNAALHADVHSGPGHEQMYEYDRYWESDRENNERRNYNLRCKPYGALPEEKEGAAYSNHGRRPEERQWNRIPDRKRSSVESERSSHINSSSRRPIALQESSGVSFSNHDFSQPLKKEFPNDLGRKNEVERCYVEKDRHRDSTKRVQSSQEKEYITNANSKRTKRYQSDRYGTEVDRNLRSSKFRNLRSSKFPGVRSERTSQISSKPFRERDKSSLNHRMNKKMRSIVNTVNSKTGGCNKQKLKTDEQGQGILKHNKQFTKKCKTHIDKNKSKHGFWELLHEIENKHVSEGASKSGSHHKECHVNEPPKQNEESQKRDSQNVLEDKSNINSPAAKEHAVVKSVLGEATKDDFVVKEEDQQCDLHQQGSAVVQSEQKPAQRTFIHKDQLEQSSEGMEVQSKEKQVQSTSVQKDQLEQISESAVEQSKQKQVQSTSVQKDQLEQTSESVEVQSKQKQVLSTSVQKDQLGQTSESVEVQSKQKQVLSTSVQKDQLEQTSESVEVQSEQKQVLPTSVQKDQHEQTSESVEVQSEQKQVLPTSVQKDQLEQTSENVEVQSEQKQVLPTSVQKDQHEQTSESAVEQSEQKQVLSTSVQKDQHEQTSESAVEQSKQKQVLSTSVQKDQHEQTSESAVEHSKQKQVLSTSVQKDQLERTSESVEVQSKQKQVLSTSVQKDQHEQTSESAVEQSEQKQVLSTSVQKDQHEQTSKCAVEQSEQKQVLSTSVQKDQLEQTSESAVEQSKQKQVLSTSVQKDQHEQTSKSAVEQSEQKQVLSTSVQKDQHEQTSKSAVEQSKQKQVLSTSVQKDQHEQTSKSAVEQSEQKQVLSTSVQKDQLEQTSESAVEQSEQKQVLSTSVQKDQHEQTSESAVEQSEQKQVLSTSVQKDQHEETSESAVEQSKQKQVLPTSVQKDQLEQTSESVEVQSEQKQVLPTSVQKDQLEQTSESVEVQSEQKQVLPTSVQKDQLEQTSESVEVQSEQKQVLPTSVQKDQLEQTSASAVEQSKQKQVLSTSVQKDQLEQTSESAVEQSEQKQVLPTSVQKDQLEQTSESAVEQSKQKQVLSTSVQKDQLEQTSESAVEQSKQKQVLSTSVQKDQLEQTSESAVEQSEQKQVLPTSVQKDQLEQTSESAVEQSKQKQVLPTSVQKDQLEQTSESAVEQSKQKQLLSTSVQKDQLEQTSESAVEQSKQKQVLPTSVQKDQHEQTSESAVEQSKQKQVLSTSVQKDQLEQTSESAVEQSKQKQVLSTSVQKDQLEQTSESAVEQSEQKQVLSTSVQKDQLEQTSESAVEQSKQKQVLSTSVQKDQLEQTSECAVEQSKQNQALSTSVQKDQLEQTSESAVEQSKQKQVLSTSVQKDQLEQTSESAVEQSKQKQVLSTSVQKDQLEQTSESAVEQSEQKQVLSTSVQKDQLEQTSESAVEQSKQKQVLSTSVQKDQLEQTSESAVEQSKQKQVLSTSVQKDQLEQTSESAVEQSKQNQALSTSVQKDQLEQTSESVEVQSNQKQIESTSVQKEQLEDQCALLQSTSTEKEQIEPNESITCEDEASSKESHRNLSCPVASETENLKHNGFGSCGDHSFEGNAVQASFSVASVNLEQKSVAESKAYHEQSLVKLVHQEVPESQPIKLEQDSQKPRASEDQAFSKMSLQDRWQAAFKNVGQRKNSRPLQGKHSLQLSPRKIGERSQSETQSSRGLQSTEKQTELLRNKINNNGSDCSKTSSSANMSGEPVKNSLSYNLHLEKPSIPPKHCKIFSGRQRLPPEYYVTFEDHFGKTEESIRSDAENIPLKSKSELNTILINSNVKGCESSQKVPKFTTIKENGNLENTNGAAGEININDTSVIVQANYKDNINGVDTTEHQACERNSSDVLHHDKEPVKSVDSLCSDGNSAVVCSLQNPCSSKDLKRTHSQLECPAQLTNKRRKDEEGIKFARSKTSSNITSDKHLAHKGNKKRKIDESEPLLGPSGSKKAIESASDNLLCNYDESKRRKCDGDTSLASGSRVELCGVVKPLSHSDEKRKGSGDDTLMKSTGSKTEQNLGSDDSLDNENKRRKTQGGYIPVKYTGNRELEFGSGKSSNHSNGNRRSTIDAGSVFTKPAGNKKSVVCVSDKVMAISSEGKRGKSTDFTQVSPSKSKEAQDPVHDTPLDHPKNKRKENSRNDSSVEIADKREAQSSISDRMPSHSNETKRKSNGSETFVTPSENRKAQDSLTDKLLASSVENKERKSTGIDILETKEAQDSASEKDSHINKNEKRRHDRRKSISDTCVLTENREAQLLERHSSHSNETKIGKSDEDNTAIKSTAKRNTLNYATDNVLLDTNGGERKGRETLHSSSDEYSGQSKEKKRRKSDEADDSVKPTGKKTSDSTGNKVVSDSSVGERKEGKTQHSGHSREKKRRKSDEADNSVKPTGKKTLHSTADKILSDDSSVGERKDGKTQHSGHSREKKRRQSDEADNCVKSVGKMADSATDKVLSDSSVGERKDRKYQHSGNSREKRRQSDEADNCVKFAGKKTLNSATDKVLADSSVGERKDRKAQHSDNSREKRRQSDETDNCVKFAGKKTLDSATDKVLADSSVGERKDRKAQHSDNSREKRRQSDEADNCVKSAGKKTDSATDKVLADSNVAERKNKETKHVVESKRKTSDEADNSVKLKGKKMLHSVADKLLSESYVGERRSKETHNSGHSQENKREKSDGADTSIKYTGNNTVDSAADNILADSKRGERKGKETQHSGHPKVRERRKGDGVDDSVNSIEKKISDSAADKVLADSNVGQRKSRETQHCASDTHSGHCKLQERRKSDTVDDSVKSRGKKMLDSALNKVMANSITEEKGERIGGDISKKSTKNREAERAVSEWHSGPSNGNEKIKRDGSDGSVGSTKWKKSLSSASDKVLSSSNGSERLKTIEDGASTKVSKKREAQGSVNSKSSAHVIEKKRRKSKEENNGKKIAPDSVSNKVLANSDEIKGEGNTSMRSAGSSTTVPHCESNRVSVQSGSKMSKADETVTRQENSKAFTNCGESKKLNCNGGDLSLVATGSRDGIESANDSNLTKQSKYKAKEDNESSASVKSITSKEAAMLTNSSANSENIKRKESDRKSRQREKADNSSSHSKHTKTGKSNGKDAKPEGSTTIQNTAEVYHNENKSHSTESVCTYNAATVVHSDHGEEIKSNDAGTSVKLPENEKVENTGDEQKEKEKKLHAQHSSFEEAMIAQGTSITCADGEKSREKDCSNVSLSGTGFYKTELELLQKSERNNSFKCSNTDNASEGIHFSHTLMEKLMCLFGDDEIREHSFNPAVSKNILDEVTNSVNTGASRGLEQPQYIKQSNFELKDVAGPEIEIPPPVAVTITSKFEAVSTSDNASITCKSDKNEVNNVSEMVTPQMILNMAKTSNCCGEKGNILYKKGPLQPITQEHVDLKDKEEEKHPAFEALSEGPSDGNEDNRAAEENEDVKEESVMIIETTHQPVVINLADSEEEICDDDGEVEVVKIVKLNKGRDAQRKVVETQEKVSCKTDKSVTEISRLLMRTKNDIFLDQDSNVLEAHEVNREVLSKENETRTNTSNVADDDSVANSSGVVDIGACSSTCESDNILCNKPNTSPAAEVTSLAAASSTDIASSDTVSSTDTAPRIRCVDIRTLRSAPGFFFDSDMKLSKATECIFVIVKAFHRCDERINFASGLSEEKKNREIEQAKSDFETSLGNVYEELLELFSSLETTFHVEAKFMLTKRLNNMAAPKVYSEKDVEKCIATASRLYQLRNTSQVSTVPRDHQNANYENISSCQRQNSDSLQSAPNVPSAVNQLVDQPHTRQPVSAEYSASYGTTGSLPPAQTERMDQNIAVQSSGAQQRIALQYSAVAVSQPISGYNAVVPNIAIQNQVPRTEQAASQVTQPVNYNMISNSLSQNQGMAQVYPPNFGVAPLNNAVSRMQASLANETQQRHSLQMQQRYQQPWQNVQNAMVTSEGQNARLQEYIQQNSTQAPLTLQSLLQNNGQQNLQIPNQQVLNGRHNVNVTSAGSVSTAVLLQRQRSSDSSFHNVPPNRLNPNSYQQNLQIRHGYQQNNNYANVNESRVSVNSTVSNPANQLQHQRSNGPAAVPNPQSQHSVGPPAYSEWLRQEQNRRVLAQVNRNLQIENQPMITGNSNRTVTSTAPLNQSAGSGSNYMQPVQLDSGNSNIKTSITNIANLGNVASNTQGRVKVRRRRNAVTLEENLDSVRNRDTRTSSYPNGAPVHENLDSVRNRDTRTSSYPNGAPVHTLQQMPPLYPVPPNWRAGVYPSFNMLRPPCNGNGSAFAASRSHENIFPQSQVIPNNYRWPSALQREHSNSAMRVQGTEAVRQVANANANALYNPLGSINTQTANQKTNSGSSEATLRSMALQRDNALSTYNMRNSVSESYHGPNGSQNNSYLIPTSVNNREIASLCAGNCQICSTLNTGVTTSNTTTTTNTAISEPNITVQQDNTTTNTVITEPNVAVQQGNTTTTTNTVITEPDATTTTNTVIIEPDVTVQQDNTTTNTVITEPNVTVQQDTSNSIAAISITEKSSNSGKTSANSPLVTTVTGSNTSFTADLTTREPSVTTLQNTSNCVAAILAAEGDSNSRNALTNSLIVTTATSCNTTSIANVTTTEANIDILQDASDCVVAISDNTCKELSVVEKSPDSGKALTSCVSDIEGVVSSSDTNTLNNRQDTPISDFHPPNTVKQTPKLRQVRILRNTHRELDKQLEGTSLSNSAESVPKNSVENGNFTSASGPARNCSSGAAKFTQSTQPVQAPGITGITPSPSPENVASAAANFTTNTSVSVLQNTEADTTCAEGPSPVCEVSSVCSTSLKQPVDKSSPPACGEGPNPVCVKVSTECSPVNESSPPANEENRADDGGLHAAQMDFEDELSEQMPRTFSRDSGYRTPSPEVAIQDDDEIGFLCTTCGKDAKLMCGICQARLYCSVECQAKDWDNHYLYCAVHEDDDK